MNKYDAVPGTCWKFVQDVAPDLARKLHYTTAMNDMLFSNDVINQSIYTKIRKQLSEAKWTSEDTYTLLVDVLPKTDNVRYMKFCCLLREKSNVPLMGKILCDKCKAFEKCIVIRKEMLYITSSCQLFFNNITDKNDIPDDPNYVDETDNETVVVVHLSAFVCIDNEVFATLTISVEEKYINKELLQEKIASTLEVNVFEVHVHIEFSRTNSTWMLLRLLRQAGLRLMEMLSSQESKHYFGLMIAEAFYLESARNVSIELILSNLLSCRIYVIPTGSFYVKSDEEDVYRMTDGMISLVMSRCH